MEKSKNLDRRTEPGRHSTRFIKIPISCTTLPYCVVTRALSPNIPKGMRSKLSQLCAHFSPKWEWWFQYLRTSSRGIATFALLNRYSITKCGSNIGLSSNRCLNSPSLKSLNFTGTRIVCISLCSRQPHVIKRNQHSLKGHLSILYISMKTQVTLELEALQKPTRMSVSLYNVGPSMQDVAHKKRIPCKPPVRISVIQESGPSPKTRHQSRELFLPDSLPSLRETGCITRFPVSWAARTWNNSGVGIQ